MVIIISWLDWLLIMLSLKARQSKNETPPLAINLYSYLREIFTSIFQNDIQSIDNFITKLSGE